MDIVAPSPTSVYLYYDRTGILIYAGITSRGIRRQVEHNETKDWWHLVASQSVEHFDTRSDALAREAELIRRHTPPFNRQHNQHHAKVRKAYLDFLATQAVRLPLPDAIASLPGKRIELDLHEATTPHCILRTRMEDAQVAMALSLPEPVRTYGFSKAASVNKIERVGPVVLLHLTRRLTRPLIDAHAVLCCDPKRPLEAARLRVVQLRVDKSEAA